MALADPRLITCCYVVLNRQVPPEGELQFTPNFCNTLFDAPQNTSIQSLPYGLEISSPGKQALRRFVFNPAKLEVMVEDSLDLMRVMGRVYEQLDRSKFVLDPRAHGLNYELDFRVPTEQTAAEWLTERFARSGFRNLGSGDVRLASLHVAMEHYDEMRTLKLEPRAVDERRVFAYVNLHYEPGRLLKGESLESAIELGLNRAKDLLGKLLDV